MSARYSKTIVCAGICLLLAQPAFAQQAACVHMKVGVGYAAHYAVVFNGVNFGGNGKKINVGQTGCVTLPVSGMSDGSHFTMHVYPVASRKDQTCQPAPATYSSSAQGKLIYNATGGVQTPKCRQ